MRNNMRNSLTFAVVSVILALSLLVPMLGILAGVAQAATLPDVRTMSSVTSITTSSATIWGWIADDGGSSIVERRFDWGTSTPLTQVVWNNAITVSGSFFWATLSGLLPNTTYYFRAWARNSLGWGYGSIYSFTTAQAATLSFTNLTPSTITTSTAPYDATLTATGTNFNNVNRITFTWSGAASGSATWDKGTSDWNNKVTVNSDISMTLRPRVVETSPTWSGTVAWTVTLRDTSGATASRTFTVTYTPSETISTPSKPSGPTSGTVGTTYTYTTGGATSNLGHSVQYYFVWGDGTNSGWLPVGTTSATKSWSLASTDGWAVSARARCTTHTGIVSAWSSPLVVNISEPTPNELPTAYIDSMTPDPATQGTHTVSFAGHGTDPDGSVVGYNWRSSRDGQLSTSSSFSKAASALSAGTHTIYFKVKDDDGDWSTEVTTTLTIESAPTLNELPTAYIDSITPDPATQGTHTVSFAGHGTDPDGSVVGYNWRSSRDGQLSTSSSFSKAASALSAGTHTIYFKVKDDDGDWSPEVTSTMMINPAPQPEQIDLTLYVHENSTDGPIIAGAKVTGMDGAGNSFDQTSNAGGYVTIIGMPGTWSFTASRTGYDTASWSQSITTSQTRHAYLTKQGAEGTAPDPPSNLMATAGTNDIQLNWDPPANDGGSPVTGYRIYRGTSSGSETYYSAVSGTSFKNTAVTTGTVYYYYVTAVNMVGESSASNRASAAVGAPSLVQLIEQLTIESVAVTVDGQSYFILTLEHRIDPTTLQVVADSGQTKLYTDVNGDPVSDGTTAQKIGIIETAREIGDPQLSQRIAVLGEMREAVSQIGGNGWVNIVTRGVADQIKWQRVYNFEDYLRYWDPARTTWRNIGTATSKSPPAGLLAKAATALLEKILGDPFEEVKNDLQTYLSDAISSYDSIAGVDNSEIVDYSEASGFLNNLYRGKNNEEIASYLNEKLLNNIYNLLNGAGPIASILSLSVNVPLLGQTLALLEFPKLALKSALATDWTVDTIYQSVFNQYKVTADLLYKLTDNAEYSLELAQAHQEVTDYKVKYGNAMTTARTEAGKVPQAVYDYLADIDTWWDSFVTVVTLGQLRSPGEFRVYDSQGRVTGLVDGQVKEEIPDSVYADETVLIFSSSDTYRYQVVGMDQGTYGLEVVSIEEEDVRSLGVTNVPIVFGEVHQYRIESGALSSGQAVVIVETDLDNDGEFDETIERSIPKTPTDPAPAHNATEVSLDTTLSWIGDDSGSVAYNVYFGTDTDPLLVSGRQSETEYGPTLDEGTTYCWRVVAIDEHGICTGGSVWSFTTGDVIPSSPCFVTTAAYGSSIADEIEILREFRDEYLVTNPVGQAMVDSYYRVSPPIASFITEHPGLKPVVRATLLPAVAMSSVAVNTTSAEKMVMVGLVVLVSLGLAIWRTKRRSRGPQHT